MKEIKEHIVKDSRILANTPQRTISYKPNPALDDLIDRLKSLPEPLQKE